MKPYTYLTCCIDSTGELINAMEEDAVEVSYDKFRRHCDPQECPQLQTYETDKRRGLTLKDDYMVSYHRATYNGVPCYYVLWSAINLIWVPVAAAARLRKERRVNNDTTACAQSLPTGWIGTRDLAGLNGSWLPGSGSGAGAGQPG